MKRIILICTLVLCLLLCSCSVDVQRQEDIDNSGSSNTSMFIEVERGAIWRIVYHRDTKVMYAVSIGGYNGGNFTPLVNADGTPMVYGG